MRFVAADLPEAGDLTDRIMALVAQQEREAIFRHAAAKAHGVRLGNPTGATALRRTLQAVRLFGSAPCRASQNSRAPACDAVIHSSLVGSTPTTTLLAADEIIGLLSRLAA